MESTASIYKDITDDFAKSVERVRNDAQVELETKYYTDTVGSIKSIQDFLSNDRIYRTAMTAFGLTDMVYAKAFVKKILYDGIDSSQSFTNQLLDPRFQELASTFNFKTLGAAATESDLVRKGVVDKFLRVKLEERVGILNEGVRLALYFRRRAANITSAYSILGDATLYNVAQLALGLLPATNSKSLSDQITAIESQLDISNLTDPETIDKFLAKFLSKWDLKQNTGRIPPLVSLSMGAHSIASTETLNKIQSLSRRGKH